MSKRSNHHLSAGTEGSRKRIKKPIGDDGTLTWWALCQLPWLPRDITGVIAHLVYRLWEKATTTWLRLSSVTRIAFDILDQLDGDFTMDKAALATLEEAADDAVITLFARADRIGRYAHGGALVPEDMRIAAEEMPCFARPRVVQPNDSDSDDVTTEESDDVTVEESVESAH